ncbi:hypothetical protein [Sphingomonas sp.]|uniref:hypothetical protein n=1 Tax=Sphingomonas sp. TaxID=28214 RepID=UPI003B3AAF2C
MGDDRNGQSPEVEMANDEGADPSHDIERQNDGASSDSDATSTTGPEDSDTDPEAEAHPS